MEKTRILIVDDDEPIRTQMKWALIKDYDVFTAVDGESSIQAFEAHHPPIVLLDLGLPPDQDGKTEGMKLLRRLLELDPALKVIVITGNADRASALEAISQGAHDFFTKPVQIDELKAILKRADYVYSLEMEYRELQQQVETKGFGELVGTSRRMQEVFATTKKVATTDVPVLITGESGTGKELIARAIHANSLRRDRQLVPINCGAIPENLMESELFGHEKGAFTGAHIQRAGRIELAKGGTLFLDEVGELPLALQVKLLRFLQDHKIERIGGREPISVDLRVIAATNKDLKTLTSEGRFREDLYYRLAVVSVEVPPLRDRGDDILLLARTFLKKYCVPAAGPKTFSHDAVEAMMSYEWPGNVRELENRVRRAVTFSESKSVTSADLGFSPPQIPQTLNLRKAREDLDIKIITTAISKNGGNISKAAEELGLSRPTLHHLIKRYHITTKSERSC